MTLKVTSSLSTCSIIHTSVSFVVFQRSPRNVLFKLFSALNTGIDRETGGEALVAEDNMVRRTCTVKREDNGKWGN